MIEIHDFWFDTMLNHHLSQKLKLIGNGKFNHLIHALTIVEYSHPVLCILMFSWLFNIHQPPPIRLTAYNYQIMVESFT
jgi:hypothetical protein